MRIKAGFQAVNLPSPLGRELCGYGFYLDRRGEEVLDELKARALFLEADGSRALLVSCDLIGFSVEFTDALRKEIALSLNIPVENILLGCTHTHSGPATANIQALGRVDPDYVNSLGPVIKEAAEAAGADLDEGVLSIAAETIEPVGFNRRTWKFEPIDPVLKVGVLKRRADKIYLLNYGCHPVILGPSPAISADWPGAVIRRIEAEGHGAVVFQGFCGNIDPVSQMNRWGKGTERDIEYYGELIAARAFKAERYARASKAKGLRVLERRIDLPLDVPSSLDVEKERSFVREHFKKALPNTERFLDDWEYEARRKHAGLLQDPFIKNVPLQAISMGDLKIMALPGEVDCEYGLFLQERWGPLFCIGYSGGVAGYMPVASAFENPKDYACYLAPKFYGGLFPFSRGIEDLLLGECDSMLAEITRM